MTTLRPYKDSENQFEIDVENFEHFNGTKCLVMVDITRVGNTEALKRATAGRPAPTVAELGDLIEAEIRQKIKACPAGTDAKVQLLYHAYAKPLPVRAGKIMQWRMQDSIKHALKKFQQNPEPRFKKLVLAGCYSQQYDRDLVDEAFKIPSIINVVTFWEIIFLSPGRVSGANVYFHPKPLTIYVWSKDAQGRQIAKKPAEPIDEDEELDLTTLYIEKKGSSPSSRCPTQHKLKGSGSHRVGTYKSKTAYQNAIIRLCAPVVPFAYTFAYDDADSEAEDFSCPNTSCQNKSLSNVQVTNYNFVPRTSIVRSIFSFIGIVNQWVLDVDYDWTATLDCS